MREGWLETTLGEAARLVMGQSPPGSSYNTSGEGLPFIQGSAEFGAHYPAPVKWCSEPRKIAQPGDVLLSVRAPVGDTNIAHEQIAIGRGLAIVRGMDGVASTAFLRLVLAHGTERLLVRSGGSTFTSITGAALKGLPILLPPPDEQRRIVDLVGALDNVIEAADPRPSRRAYDALLGSVASGPGEPLADALTLRKDSAPLHPDRRYRILGVLRSGEGFVDRGEITGSATGYPRMTEVRPNELVYRKLTAWEGPLSVSGEAEAGGWVSPEFPVFRIDPSMLDPALMRHFCRWPGLWARIADRLVGSVHRRKRLNPAALLEIHLPMPSLEVQGEWVGALDGLWSVARERLRYVQRLTELRSSMLTALLSGEHEIPESYDELMEELAA